MKRTRALALLAAAGTAAVLVTALTPPGAAEAPRAADDAAVPSSAARGSVTLVTGDRVTFQRMNGVVQVISAEASAARPEVGFVRMTDHGDQYVVPTDAWPALVSGHADKALFDVSALVRDGLDDQHTDRIGVIVTGPRGFAPALAVPATAKVTTTIADLGMRAVATPKRDTGAIWAALTRPGGFTQQTGGRTKIWLDGRVRATLDQSVPLIGAPQAWQKGYTGQGVTVAELDTGIDTAHPDLQGKVIASKNFSDSPDAEDHFGHGTHVASIITGSGAASGGRYRGVAPDVRLLNGKVLDDNGFGSDSSIIAGMDWAVQQGAKVINLSLGGGPSDGSDVLSTEVNTLSATSGALFVVAAGNFGVRGSVSSPASADSALAVASTTKQDTLSTFSSQGPRPGNFGLKPEIAAPGSDIVAARAPGVFPGEAVDRNYVRLSGTSMATPHVVGAAAIIAGEHPAWTGQQIKAALMGSATVLGGMDVFAQGAGRVDVARAAAQQVHALTPSVSLGEVTVPAAPTAKVSFANDGDQPVTLHLDLSMTHVGGQSAPGGLFTTDPQVTVPPHGTANVAVQSRPGSNRSARMRAG